MLEIYGQNYFIYCISFLFYFNKLYILKNQIFKAAFQRHFSSPYIYICLIVKRMETTGIRQVTDVKHEPNSKG